MSVEAISDAYESCEMNDRECMQTVSWNKREVNFCQNQMFAIVSDRFAQRCAETKNRIAILGSYIIGNGTIVGYCDQGHEAYHKYLQDNYRPILLCDYEGCPFELYKFQRFVSSGK